MCFWGLGGLSQTNIFPKQIKRDFLPSTGVPVDITTVSLQPLGLELLGTVKPFWETRVRCHRGRFGRYWDRREGHPPLQCWEGGSASQEKAEPLKRSLLQPALQKEHKCNSMGKDEMLWQSRSPTSHISLCFVLNSKQNLAFCASCREGRSGARGPFWP